MKKIDIIFFYGRIFDRIGQSEELIFSISFIKIKINQ